MPIRKRPEPEKKPSPYADKTYVHVYRVGSDGLRDDDNAFHHKGPSKITFLHVDDFGGIDAKKPIEQWHEYLRNKKWIGTHPGLYIVVANDTRLTTNFWIRPDGTLSPGFAEYNRHVLDERMRNARKP